MGMVDGDELLVVQRLGKKYGDFVAVQDLSFTMQPGEVFALLGPNGAGKTTTLRMLMGILQPTSGSATICGLSCFRQRPEVMRHVGYLPDEPVFYDYLRGREILEFVGEMRGIGAKAAMASAQPLLQDMQLNDAMEDFAVNYSHGMKKKLAMICALVHRPRLLILDEPTNGMDPFATRSVHALIRRHAQEGGAVILSTHLLDQAQKVSDTVGILHKGSLIAQGPLEELRHAAHSQTLEEVFFAVTGNEEQAGAAETGPAQVGPTGGGT